jgi:dTDP-4-dehydrorhamnose 3,5-epimerase
VSEALGLNVEDNSVVNYMMSEFYHPECARGVRWDDPAFGIKWPIKQLVISSKDQSYKAFKKNNNES